MRRALLGIAGTALLGIAIGFAQSISLDWVFDPASGGGAAGSAAWGMVGGMATAVVLAVIGIEFQPRPSTVPLHAMQRHRLAVSRLVRGTAVLLAAAMAYLLAPWMSGVVAAMAGLLVAAAVRSSSGGVTHTGHSGLRQRRTRPGGATGRSLLRRLSFGLLAGLAFGIAFGTADAAVLGVRSAAQGEFPAGSSVRSLPNGARYATTPDGWGYGRLADGSRYVRTPDPVRGVIVTNKSTLERYAETAEDYEWTGCESDQCTPFSGRIEIHMKRGDYDHTWVRIPNGALMSTEYPFPLPPAPSDWLYMRLPSELFGGAARFGLGPV
jgi:hypothetical protein